MLHTYRWRQSDGSGMQIEMQFSPLLHAHMKSADIIVAGGVITIYKRKWFLDVSFNTVLATDNQETAPIKFYLKINNKSKRR